jgi:predicted amidophosphoribosyltransferase
MKDCPKCNMYMADDDLYCFSCGGKLRELKKCECGNEIGHSRFCSRCGKKQVNNE